MPAFAEDNSNSTPTSVTSVLQTVNSTVAGFGQAVVQGQMQVQGLVNSMAVYQGLQNGFNPANATFQQNAARLGMAFMTMQNCINQQKDNAKKEIADKVRRTDKVKADLNINQIMNSEPVCTNSPNIRESVKRLSAEFDAMSGQVGNCLSRFNMDIKSAIEGIKAPFSALNKAARETVALYDQTIDAYEASAKQIGNQLDGDNGYRKQLSDLEGLKLRITNTLRGGASKDSPTGGLERRLDALKRMRIDAGNQWMKQIMGGVVACYESDYSYTCDTNGAPTSPKACLMSQVSRIDSSTSSPSANAAATANQFQLNSAITQQFAAITQAFAPSAIDVKDPNSFLIAAKLRFTNMENQMRNIILSRNFSANVDKEGLATFFTQSMESCFAKRANEFTASLTSGGNNPYSANLVGVQEAEKDILNESNIILEQATTQMNDFRTNFTKTFNRDLDQFRSGCAASEDVYASVSCLKKVETLLDNGIRGINTEGQTTFSVPVVTMNGMQAAQTTKTFTCVGFKECLNQMEQVRSFNQTQADTQKKARKTFTQGNNSTIDAAIGAIGQQFSLNGNILTQQISEINAALSNYGVSKILDTTVVEGESLEIDEATGLYKNPKNIKAVLANNTGLVELKDGDITKVKQAIYERKLEIAKKGAAAAAMASQCEVKESDYKGVLNSINSKCEDDKGARIVCRGRPSILQSIEQVFRKGQPKLAVGRDKETIYRSIAQCKANRPNAQETFYESQDMTPEQKKEFRNSRQQEYIEEQSSCMMNAASQLRVLAKDSREETSKANQAVANAYSKLDAACAEPDNPTDILDACKDMRSVLEELKIQSASSDSDSLSNPARRGE